MKELIFFCSVLALGSSKPNGVFHQEYSYKSSSSSFKNNELQHKNEDQGFYSKDGDLEGRLKPKVNSQSQHSEYTNPKLLGGSSAYQQAGGYSSGASGGNYMASSDRLFGDVNGGQTADGYASSDRVLDLSDIYNRGYSASQGYGANQNNYGRYGAGTSQYGYTQGGTSYGYTQHGSSQGTSGSYTTNANLNALAQRLQDDMTRQLQNAIYNQYQTSGYTTSVSNNQMNADIRVLEEELRRNLTRQLQGLRTDYSTYAKVEGRPSTVPIYSNQEMAALTRRLEDDLIGKLHQNIRTTYQKETSNTYTSSSNTYRPVYSATTPRPYFDRPIITTPYTLTPSRQIITPYQVIETPSNIRYTPIPNPESLTQIASRTQTDINSHLDTALQNLYSSYLADRTSTYYTVTDFDNEVNRIRDDIIRNLTYNLDDQIRRNYGQQILKNDYYYTISSNGDMSTQYNYNLRDYENLKKQVEENLLRKLNQTVGTYRDQFQRHQSQYRGSSSTYSVVTYRPVYYTSGNQRYDYSDLQRQMSQQLQNALSQQSSSYSYNPQAYQTSLDELSRELQRNLTEQLGQYRAQTSSSSSYGYMSGGGNADFESMKNQLQNQLMQQLRQGLQNQHHYSASASYSASSSSSSNANYGMRQAYSGYPSSCLHGCGRSKRDLYQNSYSSGERRSRHGVKSVRRFFHSREGSNSERFLRHPEELSYGPHHEQQSSYSRHFHSSQTRKYNSRTEGVVPDIVEDLGTTHHDKPRVDQQQTEDDQQQLEELPIKYAKQNELTQDQNESTQQLEVEVPSHHRISQHNQYAISHQPEQELEGQLHLGIQSPGQQLEDQDLIGQPKHFGQELGSFSQETVGQELEDQNTMGHLREQKDDGQELEGQLTYSQQTVGQELEDQNAMGNLQNPKHNDQELEGQQTVGQELEDQNPIGTQRNDQELEGHLTFSQQTEGQELEDQNTIGLVQKPKRNEQELEGQLAFSQQTVRQELEDQNTIGNLQKPKHNDKELEGQQTVGQELEEPNPIENLQKLQGNDQEHEGHLTFSQQTVGQEVEDQNTMGHLQEPKRNEQELEGQLALSQQTVGQEVEDQNKLGHLQKPKHNDQELEDQSTSGQQLEDQNLMGQLNKPKPYGLELEGQLTFSQPTAGQELEDQNTIGHLQKPNHSEQELEGQLTLGRQVVEPQLEDQNTQPCRRFEIQMTLKPKLVAHKLEDDNKDQVLQGQQVEDQNLIGDSHLSRNTRNFQEQQIGDKDSTQKLELEDTQQVEGIPTQKLEISRNQNPKISDQQVQGPEELNQQLEPVGPRKPKNGDYEQQLSNGDINEQSPDQQTSDLSQQLEPARASEQQLELEKKPEQTQQIEDDLTQQPESGGSKYRTTNFDQQSQNQEDVGQTLELSKSTLTTPEIQNQEVNLQLVPHTSERPNREVQQQEETQELTLTNNEKSNQQVEDLDQQKPRKLDFADQEGQQLENNFSQLELTEARKPEPNHQLIPSVEVPPELPSYPDQSENEVVEHHTSPKIEVSGSFHPLSQSERTFRQHSYSSSRHDAVTQARESKPYPTQRPFTNGHSGFNSPVSDTQVRVDSFQNALKQQDALMDFLKKKVQEAQSSNQGMYSQRTIKKTVFIDGKAVNTQETSQLIKPNGEIVEVEGVTPSRNIYGGELGSYVPSTIRLNAQSTGYSGNTYHSTGLPSTFSGKSHWTTHGRNFGFQGNAESEFSGKTTRRVVHFVNGKPVDASEKIQELTPNGEIIERNRDIAPEELDSFSRGFSSNQFGHSTHGFNVPKIYISSQNSDVSRHTIQKTDHYINGNSFAFSSSTQGISPNIQVQFGHSFPNVESSNYPTSGTKTTRHYGSRAY